MAFCNEDCVCRLGLKVGSAGFALEVITNGDAFAKVKKIHILGRQKVRDIVQ